MLHFPTREYPFRFAVAQAYGMAILIKLIPVLSSAPIGDPLCGSELLVIRLRIILKKILIAARPLEGVYSGSGQPKVVWAYYSGARYRYQHKERARAYRNNRQPLIAYGHLM